MDKKLLKQIVLVIAGQLLISCGISLMLVVNLGVDPLGVFHTGVANLLNTTFGIAFFIENIIAITIIYFIDKKYINLATVLSMFVVTLTSTQIMNFYNLILGSDPHMIVRVISLFVSSFILSVGLNVYVHAGLGVAAMDALPEMVSDKLHVEYRYIKVASDVLYLLIGWFLGGKVGVGTIISAIIVGPIIQWTRKYVKPFVENFQEK